MKFYNLNGTWVSWDTLHNEYGYTTEESLPVTYKSASNDATWGSDAGSGYYVGDVTDMIHGSFWCDSDYGWFELDGLVWNPEIYPSNATPLTMINNGVLSNAVSLECGGVTYYLIKAIVGSYAWISASEAAEMGWEVSTGYTLSFVNTQLPDITITMPPSETGPSGTVVTLPTMSGEYESGGKTWTPSTWDIGAFGSSYTISDNTVAHLVFVEVPAVTFIIADAVTGEIVATFSDELIVEPLGNVIMQDEEIIIGIPHTVPIQNFWFTANGQNEQDDSLLPTFGYDIDLYNADGTRASGAQYDGAYPITYMKADGNMFVYGDDRIIINGGVDLLGLESDEENNRSAWSVQVEKISE